MPSEGGTGRWFNLGGGTASNSAAEAPPSSGRFPAMPTINIPGFTRPQEPTIADEMCGMCPNLTFQQRVIGFAVCLGLGYLLSFMSTVSLWTADLTGFALLYCLGSLIAIGATGFLVGPKAQCKKMFHKNRRISCTVYLVLLVTVLVLALIGTPVGIVLLVLIIQMMAAIWYTASYIPYGRLMIKNSVCPCLRDEEGQTG
ncbi:unnamed protein product [Ascophyllum nodosum]